jgi:hypothetical protein
LISSIGRCRRLVGFLFAILLLPAATAAKKGAVPLIQDLTVSGYVHAQWAWDGRTGAYPRQGFELRRARLKFEYDLAVAGADIEVGCDGFAPVFEDAFGYFQAIPALRLTGGLRKMPFSLEELTPARRLLLPERGAMNSAFGASRYLGRDIGLTAEGKFGLRGMAVTCAGGVYNGNGARLARDYNNAKQFVERLTISPSSQVTLGVGATQRNDSLTGRLVHAVGVDARCQPGRGTFEIEALAGNSVPDSWMLACRAVGGCAVGRLTPLVGFELVLPDVADTRQRLSVLTVGCNWSVNRVLTLKSSVAMESEDGGRLEPLAVVQAQASF